MAPGLGEGQSLHPALCLCGRLLGDSRRHRGHRRCCFHGPAVLGTHGTLACAPHTGMHTVSQAWTQRLLSCLLLLSPPRCLFWTWSREPPVRADIGTSSVWHCHCAWLLLGRDDPARLCLPMGCGGAAWAASSVPPTSLSFSDAEGAGQGRGHCLQGLRPWTHVRTSSVSRISHPK